MMKWSGQKKKKKTITCRLNNITLQDRSQKGAVFFICVLTRTGYFDIGQDISGPTFLSSRISPAIYTKFYNFQVSKYRDIPQIYIFFLTLGEKSVMSKYTIRDHKILCDPEIINQYTVDRQFWILSGGGMWREARDGSKDNRDGRRYILYILLSWKGCLYYYV